MRYLILTIFISAIFSAHSQSTVSDQREAISVLQKTSDKLNRLSTLSYTIKRELNYASEGYRNVSEWLCYFDFDPTNTTVGFKYQVEDSTSGSFFNGTEKFELNKVRKTIQINTTPGKGDFNRLSYLYNSMVTLRNILPLIITDHNSSKAVTDTIINNRPCQVVTLNIGKRRIQNLGVGFDTMETKYNFIYSITIDKISQLPTDVLQGNDRNDDFIKTSFLYISLIPGHPSEASWYYSTYTDEYKQVKQKNIPPLIPVGSIAGDWTLPVFNENENISLSQLKGKVVLLDFWFKNCGPCIESVPHLNAIKGRFKKAELEILGINIWDSEKDIGGFCNKHEVAYTVLMNGKALAEKYGINLFPTVILIGKKGNVLYSGGFDPPKVEKLIEKAL